MRCGLGDDHLAPSDHGRLNRFRPRAGVPPQEDGGPLGCILLLELLWEASACSQALTPPWIERPFHQGAKDGRLNVRPVAAGGLHEHFEVFFGEVEAIGIGEEPAVKAQETLEAEVGAILHGLPECFDFGLEGGGSEEPAFLERTGEGFALEKIHILGKHGENTAHQECGNLFGRVASVLERPRQLSQVPGDFARDSSRISRRIEAERVQKHRLEGCQVVAKAREVQTTILGVGEGEIVLGAVETGL